MSETLTKELLACPFCGEAAELDRLQPYRHYDTGKPDVQAAVYCTKCGARHDFCYADATYMPKDDVVAMVVANWNRRV